MGVRGPIPKRNEERLGHRTEAEMHQEAPSGTAKPVPPPSPRPGWQKMTKSWYAAICASGMAQFYEPSDWMQAIVFAEALDRELAEKYVGLTKEGDPVFTVAPINPQTLSALLKASAVLGLTEGDRRRLGVQLMREETEAEEEARILHLVRTEEDEAFG